MNSPEYKNRLVDAHIDEQLKHFPAIMLNGPRAVGKTTTAKRHAKTIVQLEELPLLSKKLLET